MTPLALVVATRDRAELLRCMLASAVAMTSADDDGFTIVVADDGSRDGTATVTAEAAQRHRGVRHLALPRGGKSRALNAAIRTTDAPLFAFVDDDVELDPAWLVAVRAHFARRDDAGAQGTIRIPPADAADARVAAAVERWRTIPRCDHGPARQEVTSLIGANMLITRAAFARVGLFDERLGPGAAGTDEDTELAWRISTAGGRLGYIPDAIVYHAVDRARLSPGYFRTLHESRGRSRAHYKTGSAARVLPDLGVAALRVASTTLIGRTDLRTRALARWYHYRAMLAARRGPLPAGGAPPLDV
jgi:GT2 family glycosyltransferase